MKILVTGNLGYIGTILSEELLNRNYLGIDIKLCLKYSIKNVIEVSQSKRQLTINLIKCIRL